MTTKAITGEPGMLWNCGYRVEKPCEECTILRMLPGLEYPNGMIANVDTGMWLHHVRRSCTSPKRDKLRLTQTLQMLMLSVGPTRWDPTCYNEDSIPHVGSGTTSQKSERIFAGGNERADIDLTKYTGGDTMAGYQLKKEDEFRLAVDLMNMSMEDKIVYLTVTYEYLDGPPRAGWMDIKPVWLDIDQCGMSEVHPPQQSGKFTLTSKPWQPNFEGIIGGVGGHVHEGGVNVEILATNETQVCDSVATYAETEGWVHHAPSRSMNGMNIAKNHINGMTNCWLGEMKIKELKKTQNWIIKGNYDYDRYGGNLEEGGKQAEIMALALMFVAVPPGGVPRP
jgi:hypothetical protein